jgi:hypothetical protein
VQRRAITFEDAARANDARNRSAVVCGTALTAATSRRRCVEPRCRSVRRLAAAWYSASAVGTCMAAGSQLPGSQLVRRGGRALRQPVTKTTTLTPNGGRKLRTFPSVPSARWGRRGRCPSQLSNARSTRGGVCDGGWCVNLSRAERITELADSGQRRDAGAGIDVRREEG